MSEQIEALKTIKDLISSAEDRILEYHDDFGEIDPDMSDYERDIIASILCSCKDMLNSIEEEIETIENQF